jgi:hypothetical protein
MLEARRGITLHKREVFIPTRIRHGALPKERSFSSNAQELKNETKNYYHTYTERIIIATTLTKEIF